MFTIALKGLSSHSGSTPHYRVRVIGGQRDTREFGGVSNVDIDGNNTLEIKSIGVAISTFETLPGKLTVFGCMLLKNCIFSLSGHFYMSLPATLAKLFSCSGYECTPTEGHAV